MFSKQYQGYALVALILIAWSVHIDMRNLSNPRVQHVTLENQGSYSIVNCNLWNPRYEEVYVTAFVRLVVPGDPELGRKAVASAFNVVKRRIPPRSSVLVRELLKGYGSWPQAAVEVYVITDPSEIKTIAAANSFTKLPVQ